MSSFRLRLTKEDTTGDIQLLKGYVSVLRVAPFTTNSIIGVEAVDAPGYYDFEDVQTGVLYQRWNGTSLSNLTMDESFSGEDGQVVIGSSGTTVASQSGNVVRLIPSATSILSGRVYKELSDAITYCEGIADTDTEMLIQIEGNGVGGDVETDFNMLPATAGVGSLAAYISYTGLSRIMTLTVVPETATYTGALDQFGSKVKFSNLKINQTAQQITTTFVNCVFINCIFDADIPVDGGYDNFYEFANCVFIGCRQGLSVSGMSFISGCQGEVITDYETIFFQALTINDSLIISNAGYVTPQRLLGLSSTLALTTGLLDLNTVNGNWCDVTGNGGGGGLYLISMAGRTKGTEFYLKFADAVILRYRFTPTGDSRGLTTKTGADRTTSAGELTKWIYDGTYIHELTI